MVAKWWNSLPCHVQTATSEEKCKNGLKHIYSDNSNFENNIEKSDELIVSVIVL